MLLAGLDDADVFEVGDVVEVEVFDGASDEFEGGERVDQFVEGEMFLVVLLVLLEDGAEVAQVLRNLAALLELALEEAHELLLQPVLHALHLRPHLLENALERPQSAFIAIFEYFCIFGHDALRVLDVAENDPGLFLVEPVLLLEVLLGHAEGDHVAVEFGLGTDADRADEISAGFAVHGEGLVVLVAFEGGEGLVLRVQLGALQAPPVLLGPGRLAQQFGLAVLELGAGFLGVKGFGRGQQVPRFGLRQGRALDALVVAVGLYAVEADFVAAGCAHEVVEVPLAGVAASALFHQLLLNY